MSATASAPPRPKPSLRAPRAAGTKKRMLIIVNPYATTVSDRLKNLVVYALQGRYEVEAVTTEAQNHATEIGREASQGDYDIVVAFGGDGTLNEVVNGVAGTDVPVSVLPGGSTNVVVRTLGIPTDVVDATEHLLGLADDFSPRRIDLGTVNGRHFVFACGLGLDASVVKRVDANPNLKSRAGEYFFTWAALSAFYRQYMRNAVRFEVEAGGRTSEGLTAIAQNSEPFTYFGSRPINVCRNVGFEDGTLALAVLRRATQRDMPSIISRVFAERLAVADHGQIDHFDGLTGARVRSLSHDDEGGLRPFPVQVDGDYIGDFDQLEIGVRRKALSIVA